MKNISAFILCLFFSVFLSLNVSAQKKSKKDYIITISTSYGDMKLVLYDETPKHKANFLKLVKKHFYDSLLFHRVINNFMIQGGDPNSKKAKPGEPLGEGDVGYTIPAEFNEKLFHKKGALAAARDNNPQKASSGCQFYIVQGKKFTDAMFPNAEKRSGRTIPEDQKEVYRTIGGAPHLDLNYTVYGEVIDGLDVIDKLIVRPTDKQDRPIDDIKMKVSAEKMSKKKIKKLYNYTFPN